MNNVINTFQMRPNISIYLHYFSSNLVLKEATRFIPPTQITPLDPTLPQGVVGVRPGKSPKTQKYKGTFG